MRGMEAGHLDSNVLIATILASAQVELALPMQQHTVPLHKLTREVALLSATHCHRQLMIRFIHMLHCLLLHNVS